MYIPKHFEIKDSQQLFDVMKQHSFATLVSTVDHTPFATHLPFIIDEETQTLYSHMAKPNMQWQQAVGQEVMVIFQGPHSYISPAWYENTQQVPTWNYVVVHAYGTFELVDEGSEIADLLESLVLQYELPTSNYRLSEVNERAIEGMKKGIITFKIALTKIEGKAKLSQHHPIERQQLVVEQLRKRGSADDLAIANLMENNLIK